jgi:hypothetical protein
VYPAYGLGETRRADVKGKADDRRERHLAVSAFICQALFSNVKQIHHAFFPLARPGALISRHSAAKQRFKAVPMR